jgi:hypothetical protein
LFWANQIGRVHLSRCLQLWKEILIGQRWSGSQKIQVILAENNHFLLNIALIGLENQGLTRGIDGILLLWLWTKEFKIFTAIVAISSLSVCKMRKHLNCNDVLNSLHFYKLEIATCVLFIHYGVEEKVYHGDSMKTEIVSNVFSFGIEGFGLQDLEQGLNYGVVDL